jgi:hypothetical protein
VVKKPYLVAKTKEGIKRQAIVLYNQAVDLKQIV